MKIRKYAAIDIGSNAVRMLVANVIDHEKKTVFFKECFGTCTYTIGRGCFCQWKDIG